MVALGIGSLRGHELTQKTVGEHVAAHEDAEFLHDDSGSDDETEMSTDEESDISDTGIAPLIGMTLTTRFGLGMIENIHEFELMRYCTIRLKKCGTLTMMSEAVVELLKKERKYATPQAHAPKSGRLQNLKGYIRMYNPAKGWGFVVCDEFDGDIFLHSKHMVAPAPREYIGHFQSSQDGHQVRFDLDLLHRARPQALNVRVVGVAEQEAPVYPKRRNRSNEQGRARMHNSETTTEHANIEETLDDSSEDTIQDEVHVQDAEEKSFSVDVDPNAAIGACSTAEGIGQLEDALLPANVENELTESEGFQLSLDSHLAKRKGVLRMRGLPFTARAEDVADFFNGYGVRSEDVTMGQRADGSASGEALVLFARDELAEKARKEKHMQHIGHRYIELFNAKPINGEVPSMSVKGTFISAHSTPEGPDQFVNANSANLPSTMSGSQATAYAAYAAAFHASQISTQPPDGLPTLAEFCADMGNNLPAPQPNSTDHSAWENDLYQQYFQYFQQTYASVAASQAVQVVQALHAAETSKHLPGNLQSFEPKHSEDEASKHVQREDLSHRLVGGAPGLGEATKMSGWQKPAEPGSPHLLEYFDGNRLHFYNEI